MTKAEALRIIRLLSAMESWASSQPDRWLPDYLVDDVGNAMAILERIVLKENT